jgi:hypothetical protein
MVKVGGVFVAVAVFVAAIVGGGGGGGPCSGTAVTTATFEATFEAATSGTLCLASGDYGTFLAEGSEYTKGSPGVVIKSEAGATPHFDAIIYGNQNDGAWTEFNGIEFDGGIICPPAHHITIRNSHNRSNLTIAADYGWANPATPEPVGTNNACTDANEQFTATSAILLENVSHTFAAHPSMDGYTGNEGRLAITYGSTVNTTHITIRNNSFTGKCGDGIQLGGNDDAGRGVVIEDSYFNIGGCTDLEPWASDVRCVPVYQANCPAPHSDDAQYVGGCCGTWDSNIFLGDVGLVRYDGGLVTGPFSATNNAFHELTPAYCVGSVSNQLFEHNTVTGDSGVTICPTHQSSGQTGVVLRNNVLPGQPDLSRGPPEEWAVNGGTLPSWAAGSPNYNLCPTGAGCLGANSLNATAVFAGGSDPDTFDTLSDWRLATGSPGKAAASDGTDIGVNP